jgi:hypothetical protein
MNRSHRISGLFTEAEPGFYNCWEGAGMSDGREEREEQEKRREQESWQERQDSLDRERHDEWVPEREDS